ncbi:putative C6 zinc finger domain protein [Cercophora samala]|uniref:C6 zinc finger domain protein n=1 Tax=Cercophora samala TaxID=330535 RepID=A0AA40DCC7_9PEZI|nr:putative C6 zinc finger domain protein [Cercophora samala]
MPNLATLRLQHCWECRRRRVVCDGQQPVCTKCRTAGIVCPGYADKKPLQWLAPGQVMSRPKRRKGQAWLPPPQRQASCISPKRQTGGGYVSPPESQKGGDSSGAPPITPAPRPEMFDIIEAMLYYNARIYPDLQSHQLGPSQFVFPMLTVEDIPLSILHTLVSVTINHRIMQMSDCCPEIDLVKPILPRFYHHRGIAIRAINELLDMEETRRGLEAVVSVYAFLFAFLQQSMTPSWRTHVDGFMTLLEFHGGFLEIIDRCDQMRPSLVGLMITAVLANTTSPPDNQFQIADTPTTLRLTKDYYTEVYFPPMSCPTPLFVNLITINELRAAGAREPSHHPQTTNQTALDLLAQIDRFSPEDWASNLGSSSVFAKRDEFLVIGRLFHASVALYCILSLLSTGALTPTHEVEVLRARYARVLFSILETGMATPRARKRMTWPLIVAGVEAAGAGADVQRYIGRCLVDMARDQGISPPLVAKRLLERFWVRGGEKRWDDCWDGAYAFVM